MSEARPSSAQQLLLLTACLSRSLRSEGHLHGCGTTAVCLGGACAGAMHCGEQGGGSGRCAPRAGQQPSTTGACSTAQHDRLGGWGPCQDARGIQAASRQQSTASGLHGSAGSVQPPKAGQASSTRAGVGARGGRLLRRSVQLPNPAHPQPTRSRAPPCSIPPQPLACAQAARRSSSRAAWAGSSGRQPAAALQ
jgi:hypothetical protein